MQAEEGLIPATSSTAVAVGGQAIKEEESTNLSFGITSTVFDSTQVTLDFYSIAVDDRIYRTGNIPHGSGSISFYTNVLDVEHAGLDLVISSEMAWSKQVDTRIDFAYGYNKTDVVAQRQVGGNSPVGDDKVEDIENNYPNHRFVFTTNTSLSDELNLMIRANYFGSHYDERGRIGDTNDLSAEIDAIVYVDAELSYQLTNNTQFRLGFSNLFDTYINEIDAPYTWVKNMTTTLGRGLRFKKHD